MKFAHAQTFHRRHGAIDNKFSYGMDMLYVPVHAPVVVPSNIKRVLLSYNKRLSLFSLCDKDHGFKGQRVQSLDEFAQSILSSHELIELCDGEIWLLTQPRIFGHVFNPVSFWHFFDKSGALRAVLAEVNNTAGQRHFYLCRHKNNAKILSTENLTAEKVFYVSPFQSLQGDYDFRFNVSAEKIGTWINYTNGTEGVFAALTGQLALLSNSQLIRSALRQPFGAMKVITLIFWQALKLKFKGARFREVPIQSSHEISSTD